MSKKDVDEFVEQVQDIGLASKANGVIINIGLLLLVISVLLTYDGVLSIGFGFISGLASIGIMLIAFIREMRDNPELKLLFMQKANEQYAKGSK